MKLFEDRIGEWVAAAERSGELRHAPSWGRPLGGDGYLETPAELRLGFKVLRNADVLPPEVELIRERGDLRERLAVAEEGEREALRRRLVDVELQVSMALERRMRRA